MFKKIFLILSLLAQVLFASWTYAQEKSDYDAFYKTPQIERLKLLLVSAMGETSEEMNFEMQSDYQIADAKVKALVEQTERALDFRMVNHWAKKLENYIKIRDEVVQITCGFSDFCQSGASFEFSTKRKTKIEHWRDEQASGNSSQDRIHFTLSPKDKEGQLMLMQFEVIMASTMILYDYYNYMVAPVAKDSRLRRVLFYDYPELYDGLYRITSDLVNHADRYELSLAVQSLTRFYRWENKNIFAKSRDPFFLNMLSASDAYGLVIDNKINYLSISLGSLARAISDGVSKLYNAITFVGSAVFGNLMGSIEFRKGKLIRMPKAERQAIVSDLRPLDMLFDKSPFRMTDKFIPGYYTHVAMWVGTPEQLRALGIWDHPVVAQYHKAIQQGELIVESLRQTGVAMHTFDSFLNVDDLMVLRRQFMSPEEVAEGVIKLLSHVGKEYDFNFDVETQRKLVCSELVYYTLDDESWKTPSTLGRFTIAPDDVAIMAIERPERYKPILMYKRGRRVKDKRVLAELYLNLGQTLTVKSLYFATDLQKMLNRGHQPE